MVVKLFYLHSIDLTNWRVCWSLSLNGLLASPKFFQKSNPAFILTNINSMLAETTSTPTPTGITILSNSNPERVKVEEEFEKVRREQFQNLPSRFNCLWVAEKSDEGYKLIKNMFGSNKDRKILIVEILLESKIHKVDKRWYERYYDNKKQEYINNYWLGQPFNFKSKWEFLIDGCFKILKEDILFLRKIIREKYKYKIGKDLIEKTYRINAI